MRKLKKFTLAEGHALSSSEMAMLEGGEYFPLDCKDKEIGEACAVIYYSTSGEIAGFYDGTCKYSYVEVVSGLNVYQYQFACIRN